MYSRRVGRGSIIGKSYCGRCRSNAPPGGVSNGPTHGRCSPGSLHPLDLVQPCNNRQCGPGAIDNVECGRCDDNGLEGSVCLQNQCACPEGTDGCGGRCVSLSTAENCGACGVQCEMGTVCLENQCACPEGTDDCGGRCVSFSTTENCGACGVQCEIGTVCANAVCAGDNDEDDIERLCVDAEFVGPSAEVCPQCRNSLDDDMDGLVDYPNDPGCEARGDLSEEDGNTPPPCYDEADNDRDGLVDYPFDPGCRSAGDLDEADPAIDSQCSNGVDDDGDMIIDFPLILAVMQQAIPMKPIPTFLVSALMAEIMTIMGVLTGLMTQAVGLPQTMLSSLMGHHQHAAPMVSIMTWTVP